MVYLKAIGYCENELTFLRETFERFGRISSIIPMDKGKFWVIRFEDDRDCLDAGEFLKQAPGFSEGFAIHLIDEKVEESAEPNFVSLWEIFLEEIKKTNLILDRITEKIDSIEKKLGYTVEVYDKGNSGKIYEE